jgi:hypothetical protein
MNCKKLKTTPAGSGEPRFQAKIRKKSDGNTMGSMGSWIFPFTILASKTRAKKFSTSRRRIAYL